MAELVRDLLTLDVLIEEHGEALEWIDTREALDSADARFDAMKTALAELPPGFRVERVRGRVAAGGDPGCELTLFDDRAAMPRMVGVVTRRLIGRAMVSWSARSLVDPEMAVAFAVVLRVAAADAVGRS